VIVGVGIDVADPDRQRQVAAGADDRVGLVGVHRQQRERPPHRPAKALGAPGGLRWTDAEVGQEDSGRPRLTVRGTVAARAAELGVRTWHVSLSHDAGVASAVVIAEG
jgi:holo-[acyl-carrier protein] synthase